MIIVPLPGDIIKCTLGVTYTVLGYTNLKDKPTVYVQGPMVETKSLEFDQIVKINGVIVTLTKGKVFDAPSKSKQHKHSLPQKDDIVKFKSLAVKVNSLKLNMRGHLAAGILVVGENTKDQEKVVVRLMNLVGIERANGDKLQDLAEFTEQYRDYLGSS